MWDDIRMWLSLRLLDSEMRGCITYIDETGKKDRFGSQCCELEEDRYFRNKMNFMARIETEGLLLYFAFLPHAFHKYIYRDLQKVENVTITDKTKALFASATELQLLEYPHKYIDPRSITAFTSGEIDTGYQPQLEFIAVSYSHSRFVSWSGFVTHMYKYHWQFVLILWGFVVYVLGQAVVR